jgi:hypothetical protein
MSAQRSGSDSAAAAVEPASVHAEPKPVVTLRLKLKPARKVSFVCVCVFGLIREREFYECVPVSSHSLFLFFFFVPG